MTQMNKNLFWLLAILLALILGFGAGKTLSRTEKNGAADSTIKKATYLKTNKMKLGVFSMSLAVKDLQVSKAFYEKLGFDSFAGAEDKNYLIMKQGNTIIGLFQGMFPNNILTFNPGWDENAQNVDPFDDIRMIQKDLQSKGVQLMNPADENGKGPASFMLTDPDGNLILVDQHR